MTEALSLDRDRARAWTLGASSRTLCGTSRTASGACRGTRSRSHAFCCPELPSRMMRRIVGIAASVGILVGLGSQAPAAAQPEPVDDLTAVRTAFGAGLPVGALTPQSGWRRWGGSPPAFRVPPTSPVRCSWPRRGPAVPVRHVGVRLPAAQRSRDDSIGVAQAIAGPAVDTSLPTPVIPPGTVKRVVLGWVRRRPRRSAATDDGVVDEPEHDAFGNGTAVPGAPRGRSPHTVEHGRNRKGHSRFPGLGSMIDNTSRICRRATSLRSWGSCRPDAVEPPAVRSTAGRPGHILRVQPRVSNPGGERAMAVYRQRLGDVAYEFHGLVDLLAKRLPAARATNSPGAQRIRTPNEQPPSGLSPRCRYARSSPSRWCRTRATR